MQKSTQNWITVPILPTYSITDTLLFWETIGYKTTYKQTRPYQYGVVSRGGSDLHFGRVKEMNPDQNYYTGCLVMVPEAEEVYKEFTQRLKEAFGTVAHSGLPRISRMKPGATRFTLTDNSGNSIIFVSLGEKDQEEWEKADKLYSSKLQQAIARAKRYLDYKIDEVAAGKVLDVALKNHLHENSEVVAEALIIRRQIAEILKEIDTLKECNSLLSQLEIPQDKLEIIRQKHGVAK